MEMVRTLMFSVKKWLNQELVFSDMAFALFVLFIFSCLRQRLTCKAPMSWPVFGILPTIALQGADIINWATASLIRYGGSFPYRGMWMGGAYGIVTADPSKVEYMLKTNFHNFPKGRIYRERFVDLLGDGIFNADDELWKLQRRAANSEMHSAMFLRYSAAAVRRLVEEKLLVVMECMVKGCKVFDLQDVLLRFTFDNICGVAFGVDPGCLAVDLPEIPFAKAFEEATELSMVRFLCPPFIWKPMKAFGLGFEKRLQEATRVVHAFAEETVAKRKEELSSWGKNGNSQCGHSYSDLLSRLITMSMDGDGIKGNPNGYFSDKLLRDFCISFILAGRDTSSVGLAWFFWLITKNPHVEKKILGEMNEIIGFDKGDHHFTMEELKKMVYLHAALSESMRLYPPVSFDQKEVLEDDVFPDGTMVKKGARVIYNIFAMGRLESVWGKDCNEFRPERWINKDGEFVNENQFKYPVFNGGPRLCVGKKFAYMQMKMVAASILLRYKLKVVEGHEVCPKINTTLYMKHGLLVTLEPRDRNVI